MKKALLFVAVFALGAFMANAQVEKGDKVLNLSLGLGSTLYSGSGYKSTVPPVAAALEFVVKDDMFGGKGALGIGGYVGYTGAKYEVDLFGSSYGWKYTNLIIGPKGYLHYNFIDKLDTYGALLIGYWYVKTSEIGTPIGSAPSYGGVAWATSIGARYFFTDSFGAMAELGYGISYLNIGISMKF